MAIKIDQHRRNSSASSTTEGPSTLERLTELLNRDISLFGTSIGLKQKESLYYELGILLSAGLDIQKSLALVEMGQKNKKFKAELRQIREYIVNGSSLSEALVQSGKFTDFEIFSLQIGEETGQMNEVLEELSSFFKRSIKYRQQLLGALTYPVFVISFAFLVIYFLLNYLVPLFSDVYERFDGELPQITQNIILLSDWLGANSVYLFLTLASIFGLLYWQRRQTWFRRASSWLLLRLPIFGGIFQQLYLSRFAQSMALLLRARIPLLKSVQLVAKMVGFYPIEVSLKNAEAEILRGKLLQESLEGYSIYPQQLLALVQVGEESSTLDAMFQKLSDQYNEEVEQKTAVIGSLIEPLLIIFLGVLVGVILVAMYLPLFQLSVGAN
ncbi:MAG: type II secretion system F family protein [Bacteroidota bacterium]